MYTVAQVKEELPMVKIKFNGRLYWGKVTGRLNQFASVSPSQLISKKKLVHIIMGPVYHFSWETVTHAINTNGILLTD